jgi:hypothetical protein
MVPKTINKAPTDIMPLSKPQSLGISLLFVFHIRITTKGKRPRVRVPSDTAQK